MSTYLIDRIAATENIEVLTDTELVHVAGSLGTGVESVGWRKRHAGTEERPIRNVFLSSARTRAPNSGRTAMSISMTRVS
jgi:thioredoxin reductase (NADPH)